jgi:hypothetical protein
MSKKTIALNINVKKINKKRLYKGKKGIYLDMVLFYNSETDQYEQNGFVVESISKEERQNGQQGTILGNAKELGRPQPSADVDEALEEVEEDLPF